MNAHSDRIFERALTAAMAEDVGQPPQALLAEVLDEIEGVRPLPPLIALVAEPPMVMPSRVVVGVRRTRLLLVAAAILLVVAGILVGSQIPRPPPPADAWTSWGGSPARMAAGISGPTGTPRQRWSFSAGSPIDRTPIIVLQLVAIVDRDGVVHALDLATGTKRWEVDLGAGAGGPTADGDRLFVVDGTGTVRALRLEDGSEVWASPVDASPSVDIAAADGTIWAAARDGTLVAIEVDSGRVRWRVVPPGAGPASPVVGIALSDRLLVASVGSSGLVALDRGTGAVAWSAPTDGEALGVPTLGGGTVWVGPGDDVKTGGLSAFRLDDGTTLWHLDESFFAPALAGDTAVTTSAFGVVAGRDVASGAERWRFAPGGQFRQVAIAGGVALVLSVSQRQVYGLDVATGALRWQVALDADPGCCLAVAKGIVVVGTASGTVTAFESSGPDVGPSSIRTSPSTRPSTRAPSTASDTPTPVSSATFPLTVTERFDPGSLGLATPLGVAIAASGDFYVTDSHHRVSQFSSDGTLIRRWGRRGEEPGEFDFGETTPDTGAQAHGSIAVGADGLIYVSDRENHRIQVFAPDGRSIRAVGSLGSKPGQFTIPFDLNADASGNIYVLDDGAERITKLSPAGVALWIADSTTDPRLLGHAHTPAFDRAGPLLVTIDDSLTIVRLDAATGRVIDTMPGGGCESPVDAWDRIYIIDCSFETVHVLDAHGAELAATSDLPVAVLRFSDGAGGIALSADGAVVLLRVAAP
jgi:outer membrane protein assembly factor BamB